LPSLVTALQRLSSFFTACYLSLPLVIHFYRLPSLVIALHRTFACHLFLSLFTACHLSLRLAIYLHRLSSLSLSGLLSPAIHFTACHRWYKDSFAAKIL
jgi:hypothetical protein